MRSYLFVVIVLLFLFPPTTETLFAQPESSVIHPEWSYNATIYEVNLRQYTEEGTFDAFAEHLPRLKEMGVGILWLMPIHPIGEKNRKGTFGSYYAVKDYLAIDPDLGTEEDLHELVKKVHDLDMYIIIDWVANHTAWDNVLIETNPEFFSRDSLGNFYPPVEDWSDVIDLNYDNKELWEYMAGALEYWVKEFDIDGYRCDVASMVPTEFWDMARERLDRIKPVFMLAEAQEPELHEKAFDMTYDWDMHHLLNEVAKGNLPADSINGLILGKMKLYPENAFRMQFTTNHDENSWNGTVFERMGDGAEVFSVIAFLIPDMFLIYSGQEAGLDKRLDFFEKDVIEWNEHPFQDLYAMLNSLKAKNPLLWNGEKGGAFQPVHTSNEETSLAFMRTLEDKKLLAVFNLSAETAEVNVFCKKLTGQFENIFTSEVFKVAGELKMELEPWGYEIFLNK